MNDYHSFSAIPKVKESTGKAFVRIEDRYYPGPPGPEYSTLIDLRPREAEMLGEELIIAAGRAKEMETKLARSKAIVANTKAVAAAAKVKAME